MSKNYKSYLSEYIENSIKAEKSAVAAAKRRYKNYDENVYNAGTVFAFNNNSEESIDELKSLSSEEVRHFKRGFARGCIIMNNAVILVDDVSFVLGAMCSQCQLENQLADDKHFLDGYNANKKLDEIMRNSSVTNLSTKIDSNILNYVIGKKKGRR